MSNKVTVGGRRIYGLVDQSTHHHDVCESDNPMKKKLRISEEMVDLGHKNMNETVDLPSKISQSKIWAHSDEVLRTAMLKTRFSETILKAQHKVIMMVDESNKTEKERLERKKAETEADIRVAKMVLKKQMEKERKMARLALENMKRTAVWNDAIQVEKELEKLIGVRIL